MNANSLSDLTIEWMSPSTWLDDIGKWIGQRLRPGGMERLSRRPRKRLYVDDPEWLNRVGMVSLPDLDRLLDELADDLPAAHAIVFHGSRVEDPGCFAKEGLKVNDPASLDGRVRDLIESEPELARLYPNPDALLASFQERGRDTGRLYVTLDSRTLLNGSGHYLLYGSEWLQVLLGWDAHPVLRARGYPTIVRASLRLDLAPHGTRRELARHLVLEWARQMAVRDVEVPELDFTLVLRRDLPPSAILGHEHPAEIEDPFHRVTRTIERRKCPACDP